mgnify:CR=1 FL=1
MDERVSFEGYVAARSEGLQRFAYLVCGDVGEAHELVQTALVALYPRWVEVAGRGDPEAYVRRSIVNAQITVWRRQRRERPTDDLDVLDRVGAVDVADTVTDADLVARLFAVLAPRQRAVLVMRFYERRSFSEIAEACGCAEATARSLVHRALATLRAHVCAGSGDD